MPLKLPFERVQTHVPLCIQQSIFHAFQTNALDPFSKSLAPYSSLPAYPTKFC
jgi:hypothetical protein